MPRIDFIEFTSLYETSPAVSFTTDDIIDMRHNGESVCDIYFNQNDYAYYDIVIDYGTIEANIRYDSAHVTLPTLWKYGVKIYDGDTIMFTGAVFIDSISLDEYSYRMKFTAVSTMGLMTRLNEDNKTTLTSADNAEFQTFITNMVYESKAFMRNAGMTNTPVFYYAGENIPTDYIYVLDLPNYNNDYSTWLNEYPFIAENDPIREFFCIDNFRYTQGGALYPSIFMYKEWLINDPSDGSYVYWHVLKVYRWENGGFVQMYNSNVYQWSDSYINPANYGIETILFEPQVWISTASAGLLTYDFDTFIIYADGDNWSYAGITSIDDIEINTTQVNEVNIMKVIQDLMLLKQVGLVTTPGGNIACKLRPLITDELYGFEITDNDLISPSVSSGVFIDVTRLKNNYGFLAWNYSQNIISNIKGYFDAILSKYKVKRNISVDSTYANSFDNGQLIRYKGHNYTITKVKPDILNYGIDVEVYGEE